MTSGESSGMPLPRLTAHTTRFDEGGTPLDWVDSSEPLLFQRHGVGLVGLGRAVTAQFSGDTRFDDASRWWKALTDASPTSGEPSTAGEGLVAFGAFAFDDESAWSSVLIVPRVIIRVSGDGAWITRVNIDGDIETPPQPRRQDPPGPHPRLIWEEGTLDSAGFLGATERALREISRGTLDKVVIARDLQAPVDQGFSPVPALHSLATNYPNTHLFAIDGLFGASPETLCTVQGNTLSTTVLAGTIRASSDNVPASDLAVHLLGSDKDRKEHRFAVESVTDQLEAQGIHVVVDKDPQLVTLKNVMHLATSIHGTIPAELTGLEIVAAVHPTAAVAGTPRDQAMAFIREVEPFDRGRYAGPLGWMDAAGNSEWALALRCAEYDKERSLLTAYAGAGVVADSNPETELAETSLKFQPILEALGGQGP